MKNRLDLLDDFDSLIGEESRRSEGRGQFVRKECVREWLAETRGVRKGFGPACGQLVRELKSNRRLRVSRAWQLAEEMFNYVDLTYDRLAEEIVYDVSGTPLETINGALHVLREVVLQNTLIDVMRHGVIDIDAIRELAERYGMRYEVPVGMKRIAGRKVAMKAARRAGARSK